MNAKKETRVACGMLLGLGLVVLGYVLGFMGIGGSTARLAYTRGSDAGPVFMFWIGFVVMFLGVVMVVGSIVYGFMTLRKLRTATVTSHPDVLVVSRFVLNEVGEMVFQDFDPDDPDTKYYVQLKFPTGRNIEFRCRYEVFQACGEGMRGTAITKGDWLGGFQMFPIQPQTPIA